MRSPVEFVVALLAATGMRSGDAGLLWLMRGMGQLPLFPPNVSGWKHNGYWVNASAMAKRTAAVQTVGWRTMSGYYSGDGLMHLASGTIARVDIEDTWRDDPDRVIDEILEHTNLSITSSSYSALSTFAQQSARWERGDLLRLVLMSPEIQVA